MSEVNLKPYSSSTAKLEPDYQQAYQAWKATPDKTTTGNLLRTLQPTIDKAIQTHVGEPHPLIRSRARSIVLRTLPNYDPNQSALNTYITNQLYGLRRINRKQTQVLSVPERVVHESALLHSESTQLAELLGREPTTQELADRTGLSLRRIAKIRSYSNPVSEGQMNKSVPGEDGFYSPAVMSGASRWPDIIYADLEPLDQRIMEHSFGMYGQPQLSNKQIAAKLGLSPGAISQRKAKIQELLSEETRVF